MRKTERKREIFAKSIAQKKYIYIYRERERESWSELLVFAESIASLRE